MTITIFAIHAPIPAKLEQVKVEMMQRGVPIIQVVDCGDHYMALEGSHRLAAAAALGLKPRLVIYAQDQLIDVTAFDWYERGNWAEKHYPAGEVAEELFSAHQARDYSFD